MRTFSLLVPALVAFSSLTAACHVEVGTEEPKHPHHPPPAATPAPATPATPTAPIHKTGGGGATPTPSTTPTTPTTTSGVVSAATPFGGPTATPSGFKGSIYFIPAGSTTIPNLTAMTPNGALFIGTLNIGSQPFPGGFPGIDTTHTTNFAIRYVAPLTVGTESDYTFRVNADDGAVVTIDTSTIVDNNGVHTSMTSKDGPVHLTTGPHVIQVDYFQTTGNIGLQLFCKKSGGTEQICPTQLP